MDVGYVAAMQHLVQLCAIKSLFCIIAMLFLLKLFSFFVSSGKMYRTGSLVCAACLWSGFVVAENFEANLKLENSCNAEGVCEDQIVLSLSLPNGATSVGQDVVGPNLTHLLP